MGRGIGRPGVAEARSFWDAPLYTRAGGVSVSPGCRGGACFSIASHRIRACVCACASVSVSDFGFGFWVCGRQVLSSR